jgi:hypothetical protein
MNQIVRVLLLLSCPMAVGAASTADGVATYTAQYKVEYKGKELGTSEFRVRYIQERQVYEFMSRTTAKGLLKIISPNPAIERSEFRVDGDAIVPLEFWYEDGSRKGDNNFHIVFDWERHVATASSDDGRREIALPDGALDRGSLQVALMRDLETTGHTRPYLLTDDDSVTDYVYMSNGPTTTATGLGPLATEALVQHREGSSRSNYLWMAPELKFLPVRIEQRRDGEVRTAFTLTSVTGLTDGK